MVDRINVEGHLLHACTKSNGPHGFKDEDCFPFKTMGTSDLQGVASLDQGYSPYLH